MMSSEFMYFWLRLQVNLSTNFTVIIPPVPSTNPNPIHDSNLFAVKQFMSRHSPQMNLFRESVRDCNYKFSAISARSTMPKKKRAALVHSVCGSGMREESIIDRRNEMRCFMLRSSLQPAISTAIHFLQIEHFYHAPIFFGNPICFLWPSTAFFAVRRSLILIRQQ